MRAGGRASRVRSTGCVALRSGCVPHGLAFVGHPRACLTRSFVCLVGGVACLPHRRPCLAQGCASVASSAACLAQGCASVASSSACLAQRCASVASPRACLAQARGCLANPSVSLRFRQSIDPCSLGANADPSSLAGLHLGGLAASRPTPSGRLTPRLSSAPPIRRAPTKTTRPGWSLATRAAVQAPVPLVQAASPRRLRLQARRTPSRALATGGSAQPCGRGWETTSCPTVRTSRDKSHRYFA
jgi:hypothetical protein